MLIVFFSSTFQMAAQKESEDNEQEQTRQKGRQLRYGQIIQVRNGH